MANNNEKHIKDFKKFSSSISVIITELEFCRECLPCYGDIDCATIKIKYQLSDTLLEIALKAVQNVRIKLLAYPHKSKVNCKRVGQE